MGSHLEAENFFGRYLEILTVDEMTRFFLLEETAEGFLDVEEEIIENMRCSAADVFSVVAIEEYNAVRTILDASIIRGFTLYPVLSPEDYEEAKAEMGEFPNG